MIAHYHDFEITLLDDAVFSASSGTLGSHQSLDYIPGSALLGAVAATLYAKMGKHDAWLAFHSGRVRFGDGHPIIEDRPGFPVPLSWYTPKEGETKAFYDFLKIKKLKDAEGKDIQPRQVRSGHVTLHGRYQRTVHNYRLKTAIDPETGRVQEGQLFGYQAIAAGQRFVARLEADGDVPRNILESILATLPGEHILGRSRAAEYGRAMVRALATPVLATPRGTNTPSRLVLWAQSDLALCTPQGQPTTDPALGLQTLLPEGARLDPQNSFLMFRDYAPFNAYRRAYEPERRLIRRGSVMTFHLPHAMDGQSLARLEEGVGLYRQAGLGRLWIDPPLLTQASEKGEPWFAPPEGLPIIPPRTEPDAAPPPGTPLVGWLRRKSQGADSRINANRLADGFVEALQGIYRNACRYNAAGCTVLIGPSTSQWGQAYEIARNHADKNAILRALFDEHEGLCRVGMQGWSDELMLDDRRLTFSAWCQARLAAMPDTDSLRAALHRATTLDIPSLIQEAHV